MNKELEPLSTNTEYKEALSELRELFFAKKGMKEYERAKILEILIEDYENEHFPIEEPDLGVEK